jgi:syntaxin 5
LVRGVRGGELEGVRGGESELGFEESHRMPITMGPLPSTSGRDRTSEFIAIADRLRKTHGSIPASHGSANSAAAANGTQHSAGAVTQQPAAEFSKRASLIGLSIHQTSQKLAKLAKCKFVASFSESSIRMVEVQTQKCNACFREI